jgi:cytoskeletal protein CcmA (bactofilin family)
MMRVDPTISVRGEVQSSEDLTIEGRVDGSVWCDGRAVTIAATATLSGDIVARDITVFGRVDGSLVATEVVDIRPQASVTGRVVAARFILTEGASFHGTAEPQHLDAVMKVARHRHRKPEPDQGAQAVTTRLAPLAL